MNSSKKKLDITDENFKNGADRGGLLGNRIILPEDYVHRIGRTGRAGKQGKAYTLFDDNDNKTITSIEKLIKKKVNKTTLDKIIFSQKSENQNSNQIKQKNKNKPKPIFLPEENYLNFKESGKIPDFLNSK